MINNGDLITLGKSAGLPTNSAERETLKEVDEIYLESVLGSYHAGTAHD